MGKKKHPEVWTVGIFFQAVPIQGKWQRKPRISKSVVTRLTVVSAD